MQEVTSVVEVTFHVLQVVLQLPEDVSNPFDEQTELHELDPVEQETVFQVPLPERRQLQVP